MSWEYYVRDPKTGKMIGWTNGSLEDCLGDMMDNVLHPVHEETHLVWKRDKEEPPAEEVMDSEGNSFDAEPVIKSDF